MVPTGVRATREMGWARRFGTPVLLAYVLSLLGIAVHFALIDHTIDASTGHAVGLRGHHRGHHHARPASTGDRIGAHTAHTHGGPTQCRFAEHLAGSAAVDLQDSGETDAVATAAAEAPPAPAVRPGGPLLLSAPKHSPPA